MTEPNVPGNKAAQKEPPFQFGIRSVLMLTTVCAVVAAIAGSMRESVIVKVVVASYLMLIASYAVLRLPHTCRRILQDLAELKRIRQQKSDLAAMVSDKRREIEQTKSTADSQPLPTAPQDPPAQ